MICSVPKNKMGPLEILLGARGTGVGSYDMAKTIIELTERFSEPLPKGFILQLLLVRLPEVKICHLKEKGSLCFLCGISFVFFVAL